MNPSPLQLEFSVINNIRIDSSEDYKVDVNNPVYRDFEKADFSSNVDVAYSEDKKKFKVKLKTWLHATEESQPPYTFEITMTGYFGVDERLTEQKASDLVTFNGPAVLYGSIREIVFQMTSRGAFPQLVLPTVNFIHPKETKDEVRVEEVK
jgi:preprotein translocase subunit SecB